MAMTFLSSIGERAAKNKSRDYYRGFGGIFKLSLLPGWLALILRLRRKWKPKAA